MCQVAFCCIRCTIPPALPLKFRLLRGRRRGLSIPVRTGDQTDVTTMPELSLPEAARRLDTTTEALRARLRRKSVEGFRDNRGRWRVLLPDDLTTDQTPAGEASNRLSDHVFTLSGHDLTLHDMRERIGRLEGKLEGVEARLADRDRELLDVKTERDRLLGMLGEAHAGLLRRRRGFVGWLRDRWFADRQHQPATLPALGENEKGRGERVG